MQEEQDTQHSTSSKKNHTALFLKATKSVGPDVICECVRSSQELSRGLATLWWALRCRPNSHFPALGTGILIGQRQQDELFLSDLTGQLAGTHDLSWTNCSQKGCITQEGKVF